MVAPAQKENNQAKEVSIVGVQMQSPNKEGLARTLLRWLVNFMPRSPDLTLEQYTRLESKRTIHTLRRDLF